MPRRRGTPRKSRRRNTSQPPVSNVRDVGFTQVVAGQNIYGALNIAAGRSALLRSVTVWVASPTPVVLQLILLGSDDKNQIATTVPTVCCGSTRRLSLRAPRTALYREISSVTEFWMLRSSATCTVAYETSWVVQPGEIPINAFMNLSLDDSSPASSSRFNFL